MTITNLIESIAAEIRAVTANIKFPTEYHRAQTSRRDIHVYEQQLPHDLFESDNYYPCVTVEFLSLQDVLYGNEIKSAATVGLSCGVFAKEPDGWKDCFHLTEVIRQRLLGVRLIAEKFRLDGDVVWESANQQPTPFFFSYAELQYRVLQPQEPFPVDRTMEPDLITVEPKKILKVDAFNRRTS